MKKTTVGILIATIIIGGVSGWLATRGAPAGKHAGAMQGTAQGPTTVSVVAPQRRDVPVVLQANGTVTPISTVDLHPQTTSTIVRVHIKEGQFVKAGELMFSLDDRSARANVEKAAAQVARDRADRKSVV